MKIVTGKTGTPHITSQQFRQFVEGTVGQESYILESGENLEPELSSNNLLKIRSGMMCHHGNISCVELGTYDEVTIQNGNQGMKRIDLIVNRYSKNDETGLESNDWALIQGTPDAETPVAPAYTEGNIQEGDLVDDCPVFEVHLDGIDVTEVKKLLSVTPDMSTLNAYLAELDSKFSKINSWTPKLITASGREVNQNKTGASFYGYYIKIGKIILFTLRVRTKIIEDGEYARISMPLTPSRYSNLQPVVLGECGHLTDMDVGSAVINEGTISLQNDNPAVGLQNVKWKNTGYAGYVSVSGFYFVDD